MSDLNKVFQMEDLQSRLATFENWIYNDSKKCNANDMAKAGFYHCPNDAYPDATRCFFCLKELDGWEENDDPFEEHVSHSKDCVFLRKLSGDPKLSVEDVIRAELARCKQVCILLMQAEVESYKQCVDNVEVEIDNKIKSLDV